MSAFGAVRRIFILAVIGALAAPTAVAGAASLASGATIAVASAAGSPVVSVAPAVSVSAGDDIVSSDDFFSLRAVRLEAVARTAAAVKAEREAAAAAKAAAVAQAAAAQVAAQAAVQVAAQAAAAAAAQAQARAAAGFVTHVWTSGFQAQIDQCRGAVDVTAVYKVHVIAEHDGCGGNLFPTAAGSIVTITGLDAGRYRVIGVVARLNGLVNHAEDIPRGYDLLFQTCVGGFADMRFTALSRLG